MKLTSTQFVELQNCKSPQEVVDKAKAQGLEMTLQEAETVLAKSSDIELDENSLAAVTGGNKLADHVADVYCKNCGQRAKYFNTWQFSSQVKHHFYYCECGYVTKYLGDEFIRCRPADEEYH